MVEVGSTVGSYRIVEQIGQGSMGVVYLAVHPSIGRRVALKVIHKDLAADEESMTRFFNEARAATQIGHQNIIDVQDFGQTPAGESFIVMELLEGRSLGTLLAQEGPLPIDRAVRIAAAIADGLDAAHVRGIVHRDLKPDNVFLVERDGNPDFVKVLDFGLAKLSGPGAMNHKTRTGAVLGTAHYMAPEAAEDVRKVDARADVYALGCVLFQMVCGRVPFPGDGFGAILVRQIREPPPMPSRLRTGVPPWLEKIILHALAKKPDFRFASMEAFAKALRDPLAWERAFDEHEPGEHEVIAPRNPTPAAMAPVAREEEPVRVPKIAADARTLSGVAPAVDGRILQQPTLILSGQPPAASAPAASRTAPRGERTLQKPIFFGLGPALIVAAGVLLLATGIVYRVWTAPVTLRVTSDPSGAEVRVGDEVAIAPAMLKLARGHRPVLVAVQRPGYMPEQRSIEPTHSQSIEVRLVQLPLPSPTPTPSPSPTPTPTPSPSRPPIPSPSRAPPRSAAHHHAKTPKASVRDGILLDPNF